MTVPGTYVANAQNLLHVIYFGKVKNWAYSGDHGNSSITISTFTFDSISWTYTPDSMTAASIVTSSQVAGLPSTHTLSFTTKTGVPAGGLIYIYAPSQVSYTGTNL